MHSKQERPQAQMQSGTHFDSWNLVAFALIAIAGLYYVKWHPSYTKALLVATNHVAGVSIISGHAPAPPPPSWQAAWSYAWVYAKDIWKALVLGLLLGSGVQTLVPTQWVRKLLSEPNYSSVAKAGLVSVPSMMCTCCAAPVAVGLREAGASTGSALAYWLGNPLLNPATLVLTEFVLGWRWAVIRTVAGLTLVFGVAYLAERFAEPGPLRPTVALAAVSDRKADKPDPLWVRWARGFWRLSIGLVPEYAILVLLLGATRAWLFPVVRPGMAEGFPWVIGMALAGALFVIPTAGEVAIVQTMMALGLGAAPAGALLVTLPALSLPSLTMVVKAFPVRVLVFITFAVIAAGVLAGLSSDLFFA